MLVSSGIYGASKTDTPMSKEKVLEYWRGGHTFAISRLSGAYMGKDLPLLPNWQSGKGVLNAMPDYVSIKICKIYGIHSIEWEGSGGFQVLIVNEVINDRRKR